MDPIAPIVLPDIAPVMPAPRIQRVNEDPRDQRRRERGGKEHERGGDGGRSRDDDGQQHIDVTA